MSKQCNPIFNLALETITVTLAELGDAVRLSKARRAAEKAEGNSKVESIMQWFRDRHQAPFGYGWCLSITGVNPNSVRRKIEEVMKKGSTRRHAAVVYRQREKSLVAA